MDKQIIEKIMGDKEVNVRLVQPLVLAYIGDAVYEAFVRTKLVTENNIKVNALHRESTKYVKASAQAEIYKRIEESLTDEEKAVFKRGRNAKSHTVPKNAKLIDYKYATGFESLIGYLYLDKQFDRLNEIIDKSIN